MIIVIASAKGGSGKTTTAMHLAEYLSGKRALKRVVLADSDPDNRSASKWYSRGESWKFELVEPDGDVPDFDALVVDAGAAPDSEDLGELLGSADLLIIPTAPTALDIESAVEVASDFDNDGSVRLLVTMAQPGRSRQGSDAVAALERAGFPVCPSVIHRRSILATVGATGETAATAKGKPAATAWKEYQKSFQWLLEEIL